MCFRTPANLQFVDDDTVQLAGYASRKAMKHGIYRRAKALYDADYEKNKIPLIQSVILLAFWFVDAEDRNGSWHWIGIAISLCQTIGLHRTLSLERNQKKQQQQSQCEETERHHRHHQPSQRCQNCQRCQNDNHGRCPRPRRFSSSFIANDDRCRLWRLIWWTCYFRDTWLSYGMGRPTRISLEDCDTPLPTAADVVQLWSSSRLPPSATAGGQARPNTYFPDPAARDALAKLWTHLLETTFALGHILRTHYRAKVPVQVPVLSLGLADEHRRPTSTPEAVDQDWARLLRCRSAFPPEDACHDSQVVLSHFYHLQIYYEACVVALHRPYLAGRPGVAPDDGGSTVTRHCGHPGQAGQLAQPGPADQPEQSAPWQVQSLRRASIAAANINSALNKMMTSRLTELCQPIMCVPPFVPPAFY